MLITLFDLICIDNRTENRKAHKMRTYYVAITNLHVCTALGTKIKKERIGNVLIFCVRCIQYLSFCTFGIVKFYNNVFQSTQIFENRI